MASEHTASILTNAAARTGEVEGYRHPDHSSRKVAQHFHTALERTHYPIQFPQLREVQDERDIVSSPESPASSDPGVLRVLT